MWRTGWASIGPGDFSGIASGVASIKTALGRGQPSDNAAKVWRSLVEFGAPLAGLGPNEFAHEGFFYRIGQPPVRVDILMSIEGVPFEEAWPDRRQSNLGAQPARFIGREDLLREDLLKDKRTTGRHIDLRNPA